MKRQWRYRSVVAAAGLALIIAACSPADEVVTYDVIIRGGTVYDGSGEAPSQADVAILGDRVAAIGDLDGAAAATEIDATGLAVAPGFINMLSWAVESLIEDGRAMSDLRQGVTLEVFGEGWSMGPLRDVSRETMISRQGDIKFDVEWTTLGEYLEYLEARGVSPNVASFIGAATVRINTVGFDNRQATAEELADMEAQVHAAMEEGALGVGSSLIYAPGNFADSAELTALARAAGAHGGMYISHMRSEGKRLEEALEELITIAREAGVAAEIYHLKASGRSNWDKLERVFETVEAARAEGLAITADMYTYPAGATGLDAAMPLWVQEGGFEAWVARLRDPETRARVLAEMRSTNGDWENLFLESGPDKMLLVGFKSEALKPLTGKTLAEVAEMRGTSPEETAMDLVIEDNSRVGTIYFMMNEANLPRKIARPWVSFGSDEEAAATEGVFLLSNNHPRAFGTFARLLGKYVREDGVISLAEAVRRLTSLPAGNIKIRDRGRLGEGYFADVVVFDADKIIDHATFAEPHQYATGVVHVFVNGGHVIRDGEHTGAKPGRVVRGPGWTGWGDGTGSP